MEIFKQISSLPPEQASDPQKFTETIAQVIYNYGLSIHTVWTDLKAPAPALLPVVRPVAASSSGSKSTRSSRSSDKFKLQNLFNSAAKQQATYAFLAANADLFHAVPLHEFLQPSWTPKGGSKSENIATLHSRFSTEYAGRDSIPLDQLIRELMAAAQALPTKPKDGKPAGHMTIMTAASIVAPIIGSLLTPDQLSTLEQQFPPVA